MQILHGAAATGEERLHTVCLRGERRNTPVLTKLGVSCAASVHSLSLRERAGVRVALRRDSSHRYRGVLRYRCPLGQFTLRTGV